MGLTVEQALQQGVAAHKAGKLEEAERLYRAILQAQPLHPDANHNLGLIAVSVNKVDVALPLFKTSLEANPNVGQYWLSYINALIKLNQLADARTVLDQAMGKGANGDGFDQLAQYLAEAGKSDVETDLTSNTQDPPQDQFQLIADLLSQGQFQKVLDKASQLQQQFPNSALLYNIIGSANKGLGQLYTAVESYKKAILTKPGYASAYFNMGNALKEQGSLEEAIEAYDKALGTKPDFPGAYNNKGVALTERGKFEEAIEAFKKAITIKPNNIDAYNNMANALTKKGDPEAALESCQQALKIEPDKFLTIKNIANILKDFKFTKPKPSLMIAINTVLDHRTACRPKDLGPAVISLLKFEPSFIKLLKHRSAANPVKSVKSVKSVTENISDLSGLPLLLKFMSLCPISDLELEAVLVDIRFTLLSCISELSNSSEILLFQSALALQCFTNEYIYQQSIEETQKAEQLGHSIEKILLSGQQPSPHATLCLASYKALHEYEWCDLLIVNADIEEVFSRQILEPKKEIFLKSNIPVLQEIQNKISLKVRQQYEESPYPRWVNLEFPMHSVTIPKFYRMMEIKPSVALENNIDAHNILIAGCGTGQQSIGSAASYENVKVLAIDLSLSSLAYAKQKTDQLKITNLEYMQADILDLAKLDKKFDIIECCGVLHHMDDPMVGWRVLTDCLKTGGLMRISLYSQLGRQDVVKVREEIIQKGVGLSKDSMKSFRNYLIKSDKEHHKRITSSPDFDTLSTLRDLLFHVQEHRFNILQIKDCMLILGLRFCGFERNKIVDRFKRTHTGKDDPNDLEKWDQYEKANTFTFGNCYQFWCQKI